MSGAPRSGILATLVLGLAACGEVAPVAAGHDGGRDGAVASTTVKVTVYTDDDALAGTPNPTAVAVFYDPRAAETSKGKADAARVAKADRPAGGSPAAIPRDPAGDPWSPP